MYTVRCQKMRWGHFLIWVGSLSEFSVCQRLLHFRCCFYCWLLILLLWHLFFTCFSWTMGLLLYALEIWAHEHPCVTSQKTWLWYEPLFLVSCLVLLFFPILYSRFCSFYIFQLAFYIIEDRNNLLLRPHIFRIYEFFKKS